MNREFSDRQSCLQKEETPIQEREVLITGEIPSEAQQPPVKDDSFTGGKVGLWEPPETEILLFKAKVAQSGKLPLHSEPLGAEYISWLQMENCPGVNCKWKSLGPVSKKLCYWKTHDSRSTSL